jgi:hypothetical protein
MWYQTGISGHCTVDQSRQHSQCTVHRHLQHTVSRTKINTATPDSAVGCSRRWFNRLLPSNSRARVNVDHGLTTTITSSHTHWHGSTYHLQDIRLHVYKDSEICSRINHHTLTILNTSNHLHQLNSSSALNTQSISTH